MPVSHNLALKPAAEREAAQARLLACRLRHNLKGMALADWRKDTRQKLDKMAEPMRGMVAAELNRMAAK
ncbi:MAG: hypothetical protein K2X80_08595 [Pseudomonadaceae bacterium]|nr:hypothetical protein [Pseudomonadaceae bacterium]